MVKNLLAMQETQVQSLGWQDPLEKGMQCTPYPYLENSMNRGAWQGGHKKLDTTEWLTHTLGLYTAGKLVFSKNGTGTTLYPHAKKKKKKNPHADFTPHKNSN